MRTSGSEQLQHSYMRGAVRLISKNSSCSPSAGRIDCSSLTTCELCTTKAAHCQFCGIACTRANIPCPALPNVAFGESEKCGEPLNATCPVSQPCGACRQWPMCQYCEGNGCIDQALSCPGDIAVKSGGTCPIRIAHGDATSNVTVAADMLRQIVVVLGAGSFRVGVAPDSLSAVSGGLNGAKLVVDARALDTREISTEADIVAPLFASVGASLSNVTALRVVAPDCLVVSNATLGNAGSLVVTLFHVTVRGMCAGTDAPKTTRAFSTSSSAVPTSATSLVKTRPLSVSAVPVECIMRTDAPSCESTSNVSENCACRWMADVDSGQVSTTQIVTPMPSSAVTVPPTTSTSPSSSASTAPTTSTTTLTTAATTMLPSESPAPSPSPTPQPTPLPTPQPITTSLVTTHSPTPKPTPLPSPNPTPLPTPLPTPKPTPKPTPLPTPLPTPVPTPPVTTTTTLPPTTNRKRATGACVQVCTTAAVSTPMDEQQAAWIVPVAVTCVLLVLLVCFVAAAVIWKRKKRAGSQGVEMVTARAEGTSVRNISDYGMLPGARTTSQYSDHTATVSASSHYDQLTPVEVGLSNPA